MTLSFDQAGCVPRGGARDNARGKCIKEVNFLYKVTERTEIYTTEKHLTGQDRHGQYTKDFENPDQTCLNKQTRAHTK